MDKRLALLIGNTEFDDIENFPKLRTPANDVQDFASSLQRYGSFEIVNKLINKDSETLKQAIDDFYINRAKRSDLALLYYSGHGFKYRDGKFYLVAKNTQPDHPMITGIEDDFIHRLLRYSGSRHHIIILDCCFSGAFIEGRKSGTEPPLFEKLQGITTAILASSRASQYSFEDKGRNSLFTYQLIHGIQTGEADENKDGYVSVDELFHYAERKVVRVKREEQSPIMNLIKSGSQVYVTRRPKFPNKVEPLWRLPHINEILDMGDIAIEREMNETKLQHQKFILEHALANLGIETEVREIHQGPRTTHFSLKPSNKVRIDKIKTISDELSMALLGVPIQIEGPSQNYPFIGITLFNRSFSIVNLRTVIESSVFQQADGLLKFGLGLDTLGESIVVDLTSMPHLLISGITGSGKSICINAIITNLLCTQTPDDLRFIMIDARSTGLRKFNNIPHLLGPAISDVDVIIKALKWVDAEIDQRYRKFSQLKTGDIYSYNQKVIQDGSRKLPYIIIVIDGLADLILRSSHPIPQILANITRRAHPTGMHLILATSPAIVPKPVKGNISARIAFTVNSEIDSQRILDIPDAVQLQGMGDMLYKAPDSTKPQRLQGVYVSDTELERIVKFWTSFE